jgi:hypothetical protein
MFGETVLCHFPSVIAALIRDYWREHVGFLTESGRELCLIDLLHFQMKEVVLPQTIPRVGFAQCDQSEWILQSEYGNHQRVVCPKFYPAGQSGDSLNCGSNPPRFSKFYPAQSAPFHGLFFRFRGKSFIAQTSLEGFASSLKRGSLLQVYCVDDLSSLHSSPVSGLVQSICFAQENLFVLRDDQQLSSYNLVTRLWTTERPCPHMIYYGVSYWISNDSCIVVVDFPHISMFDIASRTWRQLPRWHSSEQPKLALCGSRLLMIFHTEDILTRLCRSNKAKPEYKLLEASANEWVQQLVFSCSSKLTAGFELNPV